MAYYTTSYIFNNSTTSTAALMIWRELSNSMEHRQAAMAIEELTAATGLTQEYIDSLFRQSYYQRYYGFRRFETPEEFREWAMSAGVLYNPDLHAPKVHEHPADDADDEDVDEDDEDADEPDEDEE
ncbi:MAG TPA: hypothetical protein VD969_06155 [Symbiobacteriaceae bacterium]|nr:hypothetical protein [Symbiobacteriaceae bacterium]